jgi:putative SOS response-associated peptidase YedK
MCGRYYIADPEMSKEIEKICNDINFRNQSVDRTLYMKTGEIFPTDTVPVLIDDPQSLRPVLMSWGFPKWQSSGVIINARAETAAEKPMFRTSVRNRRCIIPASGFFEWDHGEKKGTKSKYYLTPSESQILYMAGLFSIFEKQEGGKYAAFVILTVSANAFVRNLHDRMPLIVRPGEHEHWIRDEQYARSLLSTPCPAELTAVVSQ